MNILCEGMSSMNSDKSDESALSGTYKFIIVGKNLWQNSNLKEALKSYNVNITFSNTGFEHLGHRDAVYVLEHFKSDIFKTITKHEHRIYGPTIILQSVNYPLPASRYPLYCNSMREVCVCISQVADPSDMIKKIHHMGGTVKKDTSNKVTHLITSTSSSARYKEAMNLGKMIVKEAWVEECWSRNNDTSFKAVDIVSKFRWLPFTNCRVCFLSFPQNEFYNLRKLTVDNGGVVTDESSCTHMVVNEQSPPTNIPSVRQPCALVNSLWFWASIQTEACSDVSLYYYTIDEDEDNEGEHGWDNATFTNNNVDTGNRNEIGKEMLANMAANGKVDKRTQTMVELVQTEHNYVSVLNLLLDLYKRGVEDKNQPGGCILNELESKGIFQGVVKLASLHRGVLSELKSYLDGKPGCVGDVYNKRTVEIETVYRSFVNYLHSIKQQITELRSTKPRFQAFLMLCQKRVECARQSLEDLMTKPVQRLPSTLLLLKDLLKRTETGHTDHDSLQQAVNSLDLVITHINEAKREVDTHFELFEVLKGIQGGESLLSGQRCFVCRMQVVGVAGKTIKRFENYCLMLFNDCLAICKGKARKGKVVDIVKLTSVKKVVDVSENKYFKQLVSLIVEMKEGDYDFITFNLEDSTFSKQEVISILLQYTCYINCVTDQSTLLDSCTADDMNIDDDSYGSLRKTLKRMTRTLSLTKSASKKADESLVLRNKGWTSDDSCRSSIDFSTSSVKSFNSDKENSRAAEGMMDETLVYSRKNKITNSMNDLTSPLIRPSPKTPDTSSLKRPRALVY